MIVVPVRHLILDGPPSRLTQPLAPSKTKTKPKIVPEGGALKKKTKLCHAPWFAARPVLPAPFQSAHRHQLGPAPSPACGEGLSQSAGPAAPPRHLPGTKTTGFQAKIAIPST